MLWLRDPNKQQQKSKPKYSKRVKKKIKKQNKRKTRKSILKKKRRKLKKKHKINKKNQYPSSPALNKKTKDRETVFQKIKKIPIQIHHFATNKSKTWTPKLEKIAKKYNLDLDGDWNKKAMHHQGRHPNKYHEFVLEGMKRAEKEASTNKQKFLELFNQYIIQPVLQNPLLLRKAGWK